MPTLVMAVGIGALGVSGSRVADELRAAVVAAFWLRLR